MKYIEIHNWKEYEKKKDWLKATELLQDEMAYNMLLAHNKYSDVKYDENSEVDRDVVYIYYLYAHNSRGELIEKLKKMYDFLISSYGNWRADYECCLINEIGAYTEEDKIDCLKNTVKEQRKLIKLLKEI